MPPEEVVAESTLWLAYAQCDLDVAGGCSGLPAVHGWAIAFHCQQAVEKAYKGALIWRGHEAPRIHDLVALEEILRRAGLIGPLPPDALDLLTPFAINDKYPRLTIVPISREDAIALIASARLAVDWLAGLLQS